MTHEIRTQLDKQIMQSALTDKSGGNEMILFTCPKCGGNEYTKTGRKNHKCVVRKKEVKIIPTKKVETINDNSADVKVVPVEFIKCPICGKTISANHKDRHRCPGAILRKPNPIMLKVSEEDPEKLEAVGLE